MQFVWFDTETTGLNSKKNDIISIAGMIEVDGKIVEEFDFKLKPINVDNIEQSALDVNGFTKEEIMKFPDAMEAKEELEKIFKKYVNPFKKNKTMNDKLCPAGQNVGFDVDFLHGLWEKCGDKYLFGLLDYHKLDLIAITQILRIKGHIKTDNIKLETMADLFEVPILAHDAKSDIQATREIFYKIMDKIVYDESGILNKKMIDADLGDGL